MKKTATMSSRRQLFVTDPQRSSLMTRVRRHGTAPELVVARKLRELGLAYRKNVKAMPGAPDFANRKRRWVVFVNGCFWHHHHCPRGSLPNRNQEFWATKFLRNRARDARSIRALRRAGYRIVLLWECHIRDPIALEQRLAALVNHERSE
jgi:DNA mismatch endonuclease (patch repair protein)